MKLESDVAILQKQPLLGLMETEALRLLAFAGEGRILRAGDILFRRGDISDGGFLLMSGSVALSQSEAGEASDQIVGPGALIGEMALFAALERPVTAMAREPSQILKLPQTIMRRVLEEFPDSAARIGAVISRQLGAFSGDIRHVAVALDAIDGR